MTARPAKARTRLKVVEGGRGKAARAAKVEYRTALRSKPLPEVKCRGERHAYEITGKARVRNPHTKRDLPIMQITEKCMRDPENHPTRYQWLIVKKVPGTRGEWEVVERLRATYDYPPGYLMKGVPRGVKPLAVTWEEIVRRGVSVVYADEPVQQRKDRQA